MAQRTITIEVRGNAAGFLNSIKSVEAALTSLIQKSNALATATQSAMNAAAGAAKAAGAAGQQANAALQNLNTAAANGVSQTQQLQNRWNGFRDTLGSVREIAGGVGLGIAAAVGVSIKAFASFEREMKQIEALAGASKNQIAGLSAEILKNAPAWGRTPRELAAALYYVVSAGFKAGESMQILQASVKGSAAEGADLSIVTNGLTSILKAYSMDASQAGNVTGMMTQAVIEGKLEFGNLSGAVGRVAPVAAALKVSVAEMVGTLTLMTRTGLSADEAATALRAALMNLEKPAKQTAKEMAKFGLSVDDVHASIRERGLLATLQMLYDKVGGNVESLGRLLPNVRGLVGVLSLIQSQGSEAAGVIDRINNSYGAADRSFAIASESITFKVNQVKAAFATLGVMIGSVFSDNVKSILDNVSQSLGRLLSHITNNPATTEGAAKFAALAGAMLLAAGGARALQAAIYLVGVSAGPMFIGLRQGNVVLRDMMSAVMPIVGFYLGMKMAAQANIPIISDLSRAFLGLSKDTQLTVAALFVVIAVMPTLVKAISGAVAGIQLLNAKMSVGALFSPTVLAIMAVVGALLILEGVLRAFTGKGIIGNIAEKFSGMTSKLKDDANTAKRAIQELEVSFKALDRAGASGRFPGFNVELEKTHRALAFVRQGSDQVEKSFNTMGTAVHSASAKQEENNQILRRGTSAGKAYGDALRDTNAANAAAKGAQEAHNKTVEEARSRWEYLIKIMKDGTADSSGASFFKAIIDEAEKANPAVAGVAQQAKRVAEDWLKADAAAKTSAAGQIAAQQSTVDPIVSAIQKIRESFDTTRKAADDLQKAIEGIGKETPQELRVLKNVQDAWGLSIDSTALSMRGMTKEQFLALPLVKSNTDETYKWASSLKLVDGSVTDTATQQAILNTKNADGVSVLDRLNEAGSKWPTFLTSTGSAANKLVPTLNEMLDLGDAQVGQMVRLVDAKTGEARAYYITEAAIQGAIGVGWKSVDVTNAQAEAAGENATQLSAVERRAANASAMVGGLDEKVASAGASFFTANKGALVMGETVDGLGSAAQTAAPVVATAMEGVKTSITTKVAEGVAESNTKLGEFGQGVDLSVNAAIVAGTVTGGFTPPIEAAVQTANSTLQTTGQGVDITETGAQIGDQLNNGIAAGISRSSGVAQMAVAASVSNLVATARATAGIESPSTEFIEMARMMMLGLIVGIDSNQADVIGKVVDSMTKILDAADKTLALMPKLVRAKVTPEMTLALQEIAGLMRDGMGAVFAATAEWNEAGIAHVAQVGDSASKVFDSMTKVLDVIAKLAEVPVSADDSEKLRILAQNIEAAIGEIFYLTSSWNELGLLHVGQVGDNASKVLTALSSVVDVITKLRALAGDIDANDTRRTFQAIALMVQSLNEAITLVSDELAAAAPQVGSVAENAGKLFSALGTVVDTVVKIRALERGIDAADQQEIGRAWVIAYSQLSVAMMSASKDAVAAATRAGTLGEQVGKLFTGIKSVVDVIVALRTLTRPLDAADQTRIMESLEQGVRAVYQALGRMTLDLEQNGAKAAALGTQIKVVFEGIKAVVDVIQAMNAGMSMVGVRSTLDALVNDAVDVLMAFLSKMPDLTRLQKRMLDEGVPAVKGVFEALKAVLDMFMVFQSSVTERGKQIFKSEKEGQADLGKEVTETTLETERTFTTIGDMPTQILRAAPQIREAIRMAIEAAAEMLRAFESEFAGWREDGLSVAAKMADDVKSVIGAVKDAIDLLKDLGEVGSAGEDLNSARERYDDAVRDAEERYTDKMSDLGASSQTYKKFNDGMEAEADAARSSREAYLAGIERDRALKKAETEYQRAQAKSQRTKNEAPGEKAKRGIVELQKILNDVLKAVVEVVEKFKTDLEGKQQDFKDMFALMGNTTKMLKDIIDLLTSFATLVTEKGPSISAAIAAMPSIFTEFVTAVNSISLEPIDTEAITEYVKNLLAALSVITEALVGINALIVEFNTFVAGLDSLVQNAQIFSDKLLLAFQIMTNGVRQLVAETDMLILQLKILIEKLTEALALAKQVQALKAAIAATGSTKAQNGVIVAAADGAVFIPGHEQNWLPQGTQLASGAPVIQGARGVGILARIGEDGGEAVLPLTKPDRFWAIMSQLGSMNLIPPRPMAHGGIVAPQRATLPPRYTTIQSPSVTTLNTGAASGGGVLITQNFYGKTEPSDVRSAVRGVMYEQGVELSRIS